MSESAGEMSFMDGFAKRVRRTRLMTFVIIAMALMTVYFLVRGAGVPTLRLNMTAGDTLGHRHHLAELLVEEARLQKLKLNLVPTKGSEEAIADVAAGRLHVALVQGGLSGREEIREVAVLLIEPLHLLVKPSIAAGAYDTLQGKRLNLSTPASGTRQLSLEVLQLMGLKPGDYIDESHPYAELKDMAADALPDGVFIVSALPSSFAEWLIEERGYRLMPLPFGDSLALRDRAVQDAVIPAYAYSVMPPVPPEAVHTVGTWLSLIAHRDVPEAAVMRLLEATFDSEFALRSQISKLDAHEILRRREFPLHPATTIYLNRNQPVITGEVIESLENLRSFIVSGLVALFLLWRWYRSRGAIGLERFLDEVTRIEHEIIESQKQAAIASEKALHFDEQLTRLKSEALEQFSSGKLQGDTAMNAFLTHVADVRHCLHHAHRPR